MANNTIQLKRSSVAGKQPNTSTLAIGELALNLTDRKLYSSDGTNIFETGANLTTLAVNTSITVGNATVTATVNSTVYTGTANNASYLGGTIASGYQTTAGLSANVATLTANNSSYLGGTAAASFVQNTDSRTLSGNLNFTAANTYFSANVTLAAGLKANGSFGTANQVLTSNGSVAYWANSTGSSSGGGTISQQQFTGDGTTTSFTFTGGYTANQLSVYLNGVLLRNGTEANVASGSTFTITPAPASGALIDAIGFSGLAANGVSSIVSQQFTANGTANSFTVTGGYTANQVQVFLNGVKQIPGTDVTITSGNTVNFAVTPANNYIVDVYGYQTTVALSSNALTVSGALTSTNLTTTSNTLTIGTASYFVANGNLGIGTSSPVKNLEIRDVTPTIRLQETSSAGDKRLELYVSNTAVATIAADQSAQEIAVRTAGSERMRIDSSGNIGIGNTTPSAKLHVDGAAVSALIGPAYNGGVAYNTGNTTLNIQSWNGTPSFNLVRNNVNQFNIQVDSSGNDLFLQGGSTERMRITSAGVLGIGTGSSIGNTAVLSVGAGAQYTQYNAHVGMRVNGNAIEFGHQNTGGYGSVLGAEVNSGAPFIALSCGAGTNSNTYRTYGLPGVVIRTDNFGALTFNSVTSSNADNQTVTERMRILASAAILALAGGSTSATGTGIAFPGTQSASSDANTLDDYEEGTWTPNINSNNGTGTFVTKSGTYVKIGRLVIITFMVDGGNSQAAGTTQYVANLPFSCYSSYGANMCVGQLGSNGPAIRTQQLITNSANRGVLYIYDGGTQETTTISYASGFAIYLTDN